MSAIKNGVLYVVATPIGNLEDITLRALKVLTAVDMIACEDTRRTRILLDHYNIKKPLLSYYEYNKLQRQETILDQLKCGKNIALVSDAGLPGISDPGTSLVSAVIREGMEPVVVPGATAFTMALVLSGFSTDKFSFCGFLPIKENKKKEIILKYYQRGESAIFYESPHRLLKTLEAIQETGGDIEIAVCRELTKKFEQVLRDKVSRIIAYFTENTPRGEFVIVVKRS